MELQDVKSVVEQIAIEIEWGNLTLKEKATLAANHTLKSLSTYPFAIFGEEWDDTMNVCEAWDNKGDIVIGNDVWIGFEAVIMSGVHIGDGAIIGTKALVTKDVPPYAIVGGNPAKIIKMRFENSIIEDLLKIQWWNWSTERISEKLSAIRSGDIEALCV